MGGGNEKDQSYPLDYPLNFDSNAGFFSRNFDGAMGTSPKIPRVVNNTLTRSSNKSFNSELGDTDWAIVSAVQLTYALKNSTLFL